MPAPDVVAVVALGRIAGRGPPVGEVRRRAARVVLVVPDDRPGPSLLKAPGRAIAVRELGGGPVRVGRSPGEAAASASTVGNRSTKLVHAGAPRATWVCWRIVSETSTRYGSVVPRNGKRRPARSYQPRTAARKASRSASVRSVPDRCPARPAIVIGVARSARAGDRGAGPSQRAGRTANRAGRLPRTRTRRTPWPRPGRRAGSRRPHDPRRPADGRSRRRAGIARATAAARRRCRVPRGRPAPSRCPWRDARRCSTRGRTTSSRLATSRIAGAGRRRSSIGRIGSPSKSTRTKPSGVGGSARDGGRRGSSSAGADRRGPRAAVSRVRIAGVQARRSGPMAGSSASSSVAADRRDSPYARHARRSSRSAGRGANASTSPGSASAEWSSARTCPSSAASSVAYSSATTPGATIQSVSRSAVVSKASSASGISSWSIATVATVPSRPTYSAEPASAGTIRRPRSSAR